MINDTFWRPLHKYLTQMHATENWGLCARDGTDRGFIIAVKATALLRGHHNNSTTSFVLEFSKFKCD